MPALNISTRICRQIGLAIAISTLTVAAHAGEVTVSAAASLTNAFKEIAQNYQTQYPEAKVALNFGASGALLQQIAKGAPVDVFASADQETMDAAEKQGLVANADRRDFVKNALVLIVPVDSTLNIKRLDDLNQPAVKRIAIGNPASVPVGRYTQHALEAAKLWPALESKTIHTQNVRQSLDYVARGEVDSGFVYATDAAIMKDKVRVAMEVPLNMLISYPIAKLKASTNADEARRFIAYIFLPQSQAILNKYGFQKP
ncbi:molybdate ABC transporter substrate-binding protein [Undibacterium sp. Di26W]|uniref:molybdate ABC transporter substrate-binding protein n=1 Tax=Undibacterium sp. Di26W TaxID=3413035 RepID=UPI003BF020DF